VSQVSLAPELDPRNLRIIARRVCASPSRSRAVTERKACRFWSFAPPLNTFRRSLTWSIAGA